MLDASASACPEGALPAWAIEAAASAPRISPADAAPLIAIFRMPVDASTFPVAA